jgi:predicted ATPase
MARLTSIHLGGFKSIENVQTLHLSGVNVFVGANGSGKSNLISFFRLLSAIPAGKLQEFIGRSGGANALLYYGAKETRSMWADLGFENQAGSGRYVFLLLTTETDSLIFSTEEVAYPNAEVQRFGSGHRESQLVSEDTPFLELQNVLKGISIFHFEDTSESAAVRRAGYIGENRRLNSDAGNLAAFLYALRQTQPQYYRRIVAVI